MTSADIKYIVRICFAADTPARYYGVTDTHSLNDMCSQMRDNSDSISFRKVEKRDSRLDRELRNYPLGSAWRYELLKEYYEMQPEVA